MVRSLRMRWGSWVWLTPALALILGLVLPWVALAFGWTFGEPDRRFLPVWGLVSLAIMASSFTYLRGIAAWLSCMLTRDRACLFERDGEVWYLDPSLARFARRDVVRVEKDRRGNRAVLVFLSDRPRPVSITARHFEGGEDAVVAFIQGQPATAGSGPTLTT